MRLEAALTGRLGSLPPLWRGCYFSQRENTTTIPVARRGQPRLWAGVLPREDQVITVQAGHHQRRPALAGLQVGLWKRQNNHFAD
jgi:hypothetical protein